MWLVATTAWHGPLPLQRWSQSQCCYSWCLFSGKLLKKKKNLIKEWAFHRHVHNHFDCVKLRAAWSISTFSQAFESPSDGKWNRQGWNSSQTKTADARTGEEKRGQGCERCYLEETGRPSKARSKRKMSCCRDAAVALLSPYVHICVTLFVHVPVTVQVFSIRHVETGLSQVHSSVKQMLQVIVEIRETIKAGNTCHLL